jgi:hypothetical protein
MSIPSHSAASMNMEGRFRISSRTQLSQSKKDAAKIKREA